MTTERKILDESAWLQALRKNQVGEGRYFAMYASHWDGIVTDPALMQIPVDDHLVHRGDGVFETILCHDGALYNLEAHLSRLARSAKTTFIDLPKEAAEIITSTAKAGGHRNALVRVLLSRGIGGFGVSPSECPEAGFYVIAYQFPGPFMQRHPGGARLTTSDVPVKPRPYATNKTCNYLPNALMKRDAELADAHFSVGTDPNGMLTEGPTENIALITKCGEFRTPPTDFVLAGTTLNRVMVLANPLLHDGRITALHHHPVSRKDLDEAREIFMIGTTTFVTSVTQWRDHPVGDGAPGPIGKALNDLLVDDLRHNAHMRTPVFT